MAKFDTEAFRDHFIALLQANMAAKVAQINAEKADAIVLSDFSPDQYTNSLNEKVMNFTEFIHYTMHAIRTPQSRGGFSSEEISLALEIVIPEGNEVGNSTETKALRYTRALREIVEENNRSRPSQISDFEVESFSPVPLVMQNGSSLRVAGIQVKGVIAG